MHNLKEIYQNLAVITSPENNSVQNTFSLMDMNFAKFAKLFLKPFKSDYEKAYIDLVRAHIGIKNGIKTGILEKKIPGITSISCKDSFHDADSRTDDKETPSGSKGSFYQSLYFCYGRDE